MITHRWPMLCLAVLIMASACHPIHGRGLPDIPLEEKVGQMLLVGFRGMALEDDGRLHLLLMPARDLFEYIASATRMVLVPLLLLALLGYFLHPLELVELTELLQELERAPGLLLVHDGDRESHVHDHVVSGFHLVGNVRQAHFASDPAEVHHPHLEAFRTVDLRDFAGNSKTHAFNPLARLRAAPPPQPPGRS